MTGWAKDLWMIVYLINIMAKNKGRGLARNRIRTGVPGCLGFWVRRPPRSSSSLPQGTFTRMIRLLPHKERNAPIECELFDYDLSETDSGPHLYEALSYTWGSDIKLQSISINRLSLPVTENLHTALSYLRDHQLQRTLWVDAVCINQDDEKEKSKQISFMRAIYAQADRVVVWLGPPEDNGDNALEVIGHLAENKMQMRPKLTTAYLQKKDNNIFKELLEHNWFRRIWVLQEVGVARSIIIKFGLGQINGIHFERVSAHCTYPAYQNTSSQYFLLLEAQFFGHHIHPIYVGRSQ
ncbi:hypothetical protein ASPCADRAFT_206608 [Aspergillus carbonarius ITEM 5010]|uniref:Heterokaryon incompatibility domain-containing protein n=1 Tax=Aspergillus carbonarius (strain ITEM 5010) TaxID=602072 RepID=A0A1R3RPK1_ASPC5|nr:hypothetical protein ASPCADRAFT_206608 [Aspergillus carbonarius ITEM 5010]